ncbi:MAG: hypothetical protein IPO83_07520 [Chitinophagaceae bacterium]|nr:hypothetical protein [Chitinophagaceae bacterium]
MKKASFILLIVFLANLARAQSPLEIVNEFKKGNMSFVANCSTVPFTIQYVSAKADTCLARNLDILEEKLNIILNGIGLERLNESESVELSDANVILEFRSFNNDGDLESESTLSFDFKLDKKSKKMKLYKISLAG